MLKPFILFLFSAIGFAEEYALSIEKHSGQSSYIVTKPEQNLKAQLLFPFNFNTINLTLKKDINDVNIELGSTFLINKSLTEGKDYDWKNDQLTLFSKSQNHIDKFSSYHIKVSKSFFQDIRLLTAFKYKKLNFQWFNTYEQDFVNNQISENSNLSLEYQQNFYQVNMGINYTKAFNTWSFKIEPSLIYAYISTKDIHTLRSFYTRQNNNAYGYGIKTDLNKKLTPHDMISLYFNYETYHDNDTKMDYYNNLNNNYLSLPSSYRFKNSILGIKYRHNFETY